MSYAESSIHPSSNYMSIASRSNQSTFQNQPSVSTSSSITLSNSNLASSYKKLRASFSLFNNSIAESSMPSSSSKVSVASSHFIQSSFQNHPSACSFSSNMSMTLSNSHPASIFI